MVRVGSKALLRSPEDWPLWAQFTLSLVAVATATLIGWLLSPALGQTSGYAAVLCALMPLALLVRAGPFAAGAVTGLAGATSLFVPLLARAGFDRSPVLPCSILFVATTLMVGLTAWMVRRRHRREDHKALPPADTDRTILHATSELVRTHERRRRRERACALETFAAGLSHDMSNLLLPLRFRLDELLSRPDLTPHARTDLRTFEELVEQLSELSRSSYLFERDPAHQGPFAHTDLALWCAQVRNFIGASVGEEITLEWDISNNLPHIAVAPHRLAQAVLNLVHNGRDAILARSPQRGESAAPGTIEISARADVSGTRVVLRVQDNGRGMSDETQRQCLRPVFPGKNVPDARLGLELVHAVMRASGGEIEISSIPGHGTTVTLHLPVVPAEASPVGASTVSEGTRSPP